MPNSVGPQRPVAFETPWDAVVALDDPQAGQVFLPCPLLASVLPKETPCTIAKLAKCQLLDYEFYKKSYPASTILR